jgi:hypothetical protein
MTVVLVAEERKVDPARARFFQRVCSFPVMLAVSLIVLAVLTVRSRFDDPDMWWHLKSGEIIWTTHAIPTTDIFSYTTGHHAYVPHEWLSQVLIYGAYRTGGYTGLMLWLCFFTSALLIAGYGLCWVYSGNAKVGFLGAMVIWLFATIGLAIRPQMIGYLLLVFELLLIHLGRTRNPRWFLGLPLLFAVWVNCHGSFLLGLILAGIFLFSSFFDFRIGALVSSSCEPHCRRMLALALVLSNAALFLNPIGVKQILYPLNTMLHQPIGLSLVQEWRPLQFDGARGVAWFVILGCVFLLCIMRKAELLWHELLLLALGAWLACSHERMLFGFGILVAPILSRLLSTEWGGFSPKEDLPWANAVLIGAALIFAFWMFPTRQDLAGQVLKQSPVKAVAFIKSHHLSGRMFNEYVYGGYLIWAAPEHPVFIDGRADIFEWSGVFEEYGQWVSLQSDPHTLLDKYGIDFCLLDRQSSMANVLPLLHDWKLAYSDNSSVIFTRTELRNTLN